jgi:hypothetical protein
MLPDLGSGKARQLAISFGLSQCFSCRHLHRAPGRFVEVQHLTHPRSRRVVPPNTLAWRRSEVFKLERRQVNLETAAVTWTRPRTGIQGGRQRDGGDEGERPPHGEHVQALQHHV